jgi:hypothetical protein
MSGAGLFLVGLGVTLIVCVAGALLVYAAVLDGRDSRIRRALITQAPADDPGWTFPPELMRSTPGDLSPQPDAVPPGPA